MAHKIIQHIIDLTIIYFNVFRKQVIFVIITQTLAKQNVEFNLLSWHIHDRQVNTGQWLI